MRIIGAPHDVVFAEQIDQSRADRVALISDKTVDAEIIAGLQAQAQVKGFFLFVFVIHALEKIRNPTYARFTQDEAKSGIAVEGTGIDDRGKKLRRTEARYRLSHGVANFGVFFTMRVVGNERSNVLPLIVKGYWNAGVFRSFPHRIPIAVPDRPHGIGGDQFSSGQTKLGD